MKLKKGTKLEYPERCPICGEKTEIVGAFLTCGNYYCAGREVGNINKWINTMKDHFRIHCIGPKRIQEAYDEGLIFNVSNLYTLTNKVLITNLDGVKEKSASNMLTFQKYKKIPLDVFLGGLNIPSVGKSVWKLLIDQTCENTLEKIMNIESWYSIYQRGVDGIGEKRAQMMFEGIDKKRAVIKRLIELGIETFVPKSVIEDSPISGKSFCITGTLSKSRTAFEGAIKKKGGIVKKGVSKKLDYLICGNNVGKTKTEKAEKCGTAILTEEKFWEMTNEV